MTVDAKKVEDEKWLAECLRCYRARLFPPPLDWYALDLMHIGDLYEEWSPCRKMVHGDLYA